MHTITIQASRSYPVHIGNGLLERIGLLLSTLADGKVFVVTDSTVAPLYLACVCHSLRESGFEVFTASIPAGEASKNLTNYSMLLQLLSEKQMTRRDTVLALGGGMITDLAGFVAATFLRGIRLVLLPTTLLAMLDACVGGKTALDLPSGKNLVGTFYQPALVLCDPSTLETLPSAVFHDGCAEAIKAAVLRDPALFAHLQAEGCRFDREYVISRCIEIKAALVQADEFDRSTRQLLNLGHTIGHAIEQLSAYRISHGSAVSIGLATLARVYCQDSAQIEQVLRQFSLPIHTQYSADALAAAACHDKKRAGNEITLVIPHAIGRCTLAHIPIQQLSSIFKAGL